jgi:hypothetical protein
MITEEYAPDNENLFAIRNKMDTPESQEFVNEWIAAYGKRGPYLCRTVDSNHVVLLDPQTRKPVHLNSAGSAMINTGFVEPWPAT